MERRPDHALTVAGVRIHDDPRNPMLGMCQCARELRSVGISDERAVREMMLCQQVEDHGSGRAVHVRNQDIPSAIV